MNRVLVLIDVQEDFTRGALRNEDAINALPTIHEIVEYAASNDINIIYTADTHGEDYLNTQEGKNLPVKHCIYGTPGWGICPEAINILYPREILSKESFGFVRWNDERIAQYFTNADEVWMCGFCTDICVSANFQILKATYPELPIVVIEDACAGVTPELHEAALKVMKSCQGKIVKWSELKDEA